MKNELLIKKWEKELNEILKIFGVSKIIDISALTYKWKAGQLKACIDDLKKSNEDCDSSNEDHNYDITAGGFCQHCNSCEVKPERVVPYDGDDFINQLF